MNEKKSYKLLRMRGQVPAGAVVYPAGEQHMSSWFNSVHNGKTHMAVTTSENGRGPSFIVPMVELVAITPAAQIDVERVALGMRTPDDDARRFDFILRNPSGARHLLALLEEGKGDQVSFCTMLDRIDLSERRALASRKVAA